MESIQYLEDRPSQAGLSDSSIHSRSEDHPSQAEPLDSCFSASDWHIHFKIPDLTNFSQHVRNAVSSGVVTSRAKREILQVLRTYATAYTEYPSSQQYTEVCRKLVEKYPKLKDIEGCTKFVSASFMPWIIVLLVLFLEFLEIRTTE